MVHPVLLVSVRKSSLRMCVWISQVARAATVEYFQTEFYVTGVAKRNFQDAVETECMKMWENQALHYEKFRQDDIPVSRAVEPAPSAGSVGDEAVDDVEDDAPTEGHTLQDPEHVKALDAEAKRLMAEHVERLHEESVCRLLLARADFLYSRPIEYEGEGEEINKLRDGISEFQKEFMFDHMQRCDSKTLVQDLRLVTVETMLIFDYMHKQGWSPDNLTRPGDKWIRWKAGEEISPSFCDPGNVQYDCLYHILRLDRFLDETVIPRVIKVSASEYGTGRNKSSVGAVNLRGNILEAMLRELQIQGARTSPGWSRFHQGEGGSSSSRWHPSA